MMESKTERGKMPPKHRRVNGVCDGSLLTEMGNTEGGLVCELKEINLFFICVGDSYRTSM